MCYANAFGCPLGLDPMRRSSNGSSSRGPKGGWELARLGTEADWQIGSRKRHYTSVADRLGTSSSEATLKREMFRILVL